MAMASCPAGFEGFEKRLELRFSGDDPMGLRSIPFESVERVLHDVQCTIVSAVANRHLDAYVLSESSLFVYPHRIIIKTCGTTQLLKSIPRLLRLTAAIGFTPTMCRYTRGTFLFPHAQPFPHTSFEDEVTYLDDSLPTPLCFRKATVLLLPSKTTTHYSSWHVYSAASKHFTTSTTAGITAAGTDDDDYDEDDDDDDDDDHLQQHAADVVGGTQLLLFTLEVCMTQLDRALASNFFLVNIMNSSSESDTTTTGCNGSGGGGGEVAGKAMTALTGIDSINPRALVCDYAFDPCGYSMNSVEGDNYSTLHVTPEDGYSYASFECSGRLVDISRSCRYGCGEMEGLLKKVVTVFRPKIMSVSVFVENSTGRKWERRRLCRAAIGGLKTVGMSCLGRKEEQLPGAGTVIYLTFGSA